MSSGSVSVILGGDSGSWMGATMRRSELKDTDPRGTILIYQE